MNSGPGFLWGGVSVALVSRNTWGFESEKRTNTISRTNSVQLWSVILSWIENSGKWITLCEVLELQTLEKKLNYLIYPFLGHRLQNSSPSPLESLFKNFLKQRTFPTYLGRAFCNLFSVFILFSEYFILAIHCRLSFHNSSILRTSQRLSKSLLSNDFSPIFSCFHFQLLKNMYVHRDWDGDGYI